MSKRSIVEIAIRIYALYLFTQVPMGLWGIISIFSMDISKFVTNPELYRIWAIVNPFLYLLISLILLIKAPFISKAIIGKQEEDSRDHESSLQQANLSFWITLLGLYFLVTYVSSMIAELIRIPIMAADHYMWSIVVANGIVVGIAVFMTFSKQKGCRINNEKITRQELTNKSRRQGIASVVLCNGWLPLRLISVVIRRENEI